MKAEQVHAIRRRDLAATGDALPLSCYPPISLDKFMQESGLSSVTIWRYRRAGWLETLNICGRVYVTREEIARFKARARAGEFARQLRPKASRAKERQ